MDDLISRQAAIEAINNALISWSHMAEWRDNKIRKAIMELPSVEPKRTEERTETYACDSISRSRKETR